MVIYMVTVTLDVEIEDDWLQWMKQKHVPDLIATGCFVEASICKVADPLPPAGKACYSMLYRARSMGDYERYIATHAGALREDAMRRYAGRFTATRAVLVEI